ncbi:DUF5687 family protein [Myroides phaeus]|nr:DUF5687 family protein [Myroides phaeus]
MIKMFIALEKKRKKRGSTSSIDTVTTILKWLGIVYFGFIFLTLGIALVKFIEKELPSVNPIEVASQFMIYYFMTEFTMRFFLQKLPVANLKPLLIVSIARDKIIKFFLGRSFISAFNFMQLFFLLPFVIICCIRGYGILPSLVWGIAMYCLIGTMHFLIILMESYKKVFYVVLTVVVSLGIAQYYSLFDITVFTQPIFYSAYKYPLTIVGYILLFVGTVYAAYMYYRKNIYLDSLIKEKVVKGETQELNWLNRFGQQAIFLKNDVKLILRNKRAKTTVLMSALFLFYGFILLMSGQEGKEPLTMYVFLAYFVTGGFLMMYGQYVPSWDSAYYPLLMTQNVKYIDYIKSKWLMIVLGTAISTLCGTMYIIKSMNLFYMILAVGVFNIGISSFIVMIGGAFMKSPVDLTANKNVFGDKNAFNLRVIAVSIPQLVLPIVLFWIGNLSFGFNGGIGILVLFGVLGIIFRKHLFNQIIKLYKKEKYSAIQAYKKN